MADVSAPIVDKIGTTEGTTPSTVTALTDNALPDAPGEKPSADIVGDKPTVVQQAPEGSSLPTAPADAVNGDKDASKPVVAIPIMTGALPDKAPTAVSEPPPAASIPAPVEPTKENAEGNASAEKLDKPVAATNGETASTAIEANETAPPAAATDAKDTETDTAPAAAVNGDPEPSVGDKRKAEEPPATESVPNGAAGAHQNGAPVAVTPAEEPVAKKPKMDDAPNGEADASADADAAVTNGGLKRGASRGKKEKKAPPPPPAGRTARKTRSQGPVEASV